jgi:large subunit ribosomal protein L17
MRHRRAGVHLSRTSAHRKALFSNLVAALLTNERIRTTDAKAKETRRLAERTITWARRLGDVLTKKPERRSSAEAARVVHAVRMARRVVRDRFAVTKLFDEIGPRYLARRGGYTRIVKMGPRPGDNAPMSLLELIPDDLPKQAAQPSGGKEQAQGKEGGGKDDGKEGGGAGGKEGGGKKAKAKGAGPEGKAARQAGGGRKASAKPEGGARASAAGKSGGKPSGKGQGASSKVASKARSGRSSKGK